jgi:hypothetical protein
VLKEKMNNIFITTRSAVLRAVKIKVDVFCVVMPCSDVVGYLHLNQKIIKKFLTNSIIALP